MKGRETIQIQNNPTTAEEEKKNIRMQKLSTSCNVQQAEEKDVSKVALSSRPNIIRLADTHKPLEYTSANTNLNQT